MQHGRLDHLGSTREIHHRSRLRRTISASAGNLWGTLLHATQCRRNRLVAHAKRWHINLSGHVYALPLNPAALESSGSPPKLRIIRGKLQKARRKELPKPHPLPTTTLANQDALTQQPKGAHPQPVDAPQLSVQHGTQQPRKQGHQPPASARHTQAALHRAGPSRSDREPGGRHPDSRTPSTRHPDGMPPSGSGPDNRPPNHMPPSAGPHPAPAAAGRLSHLAAVTASTRAV